MRGHPVFIAQHATASCCRGCIAKWHHIPPHQPLTAAQQAYLVTVIMQWLAMEMARPAPAPRKKKSSVKRAPEQLTLL